MLRPKIAMHRYTQDLSEFDIIGYHMCMRIKSLNHIQVETHISEALGGHILFAYIHVMSLEGSVSLFLDIRFAAYIVLFAKRIYIQSNLLEQPPVLSSHLL